ncbi:MAG: MFS transporter [Verrucomicrobiota bacterium]
MLRNLPKNVWILAVAQLLALSLAPMIILVTSLLSASIAPSPKLATLPLALSIVGTASFSIPAALVMKKIGRKAGTYIGFGCALVGCGLGYFAAIHSSFSTLCVAMGFIGCNFAFAQQFRFAAYESLANKSDFPKALSLMMIGGIVSAFLGPEVGTLGKDLIPSPNGFAGSFALGSILIILAMIVFSVFQNPNGQEDESVGETRPLLAIVKQPVFIASLTASAMSYGVMSFVMTATPLNMYELCGFDLSETKTTIQLHIAAMFLPSLFSSLAIRKLGLRNFILAGAVLYIAMLIIALRGQELLHFNASLIILGIGWNFLFVGGTTLLPRSYRSSERFKVQAINDFTIFAAQATASLSAGWFLFQFGWNTLIWTCLPMIAIVIAITTRKQSFPKSP